MNREQIIRDTAYAIWEAEGRPDGRAESHWSRAERQVSGMTQETGTKTGKPSGKKDAPRPKSPSGTSGRTGSRKSGG